MISETMAIMFGVTVVHGSIFAAVLLCLRGMERDPIPIVLSVFIAAYIGVATIENAHNARTVMLGGISSVFWCALVGYMIYRRRVMKVERKEPA